jgi:hypothetical protein
MYQHRGQGGCAHCDRKPRQLYSFEYGLRVSCRRQAFGVAAQVDDESDYGARLVRQPQDADAAHFEQPGEGFRRPHQNPAAGRLKMHPIVADKPRERERTVTGGLDELECKPRLSGTGRAADQDRAGADQDGGSVNTCRCHPFASVGSGGTSFVIENFAITWRAGGQ